MESSNLFELFKSLTSKELKDFSLFLDSPYHDKGRYRKETQILYKTLLKHRQNIENLDKEKVFSIVFPGTPFTEGRIEKVMVELSKSLRSFLLIERYLTEDNYHNAQNDFCKILVNKNLSHRAANLLKGNIRDMENITIKNAGYYKSLYEASALQYSLQSTKHTWTQDLNTGEALRVLDLYYYASRLTMVNHQLLLRKIGRIEPSFDLEKEKETSQFFNIKLNESPVIYIAQKIFELYATETLTIAQFETLLELIKQNEEYIDSNNRKLFFSYVRNYCSILLITGYHQLWPVLHDIQRDNLDKGYFYYNDEIPPGAFFSIANTALKVKKLDWAKAFIEEHRYRVVGDNATQDYYRMVYATYLFTVKEYDQVLEYIPASSPNMDFHMWSRRLEIMTYYETNSPLLTYKVDAFKMYLSRGKEKILSENTYNANSNFIKLLIQILQSPPGDRSRKETLLKRLESKAQVIEKDWLLQKIQTL